jgi:hypothetical protein
MVRSRIYLHYGRIAYEISDVVVGYDAAQEHIILRSGTTGRKVMPLGVFEKTWARSDYWGLIILQPEKMPALAKETTSLFAVLGLEKAPQFQDALSGYRTALTRWPQSLAARMELGYSYYFFCDFTKGKTSVYPSMSVNNKTKINLCNRSFFL